MTQIGDIASKKPKGMDTADFGVDKEELDSLVDLFSGSGLSQRESTVLAYISLKGDTNANEIIAATGKKQSSVSQELARLETVGLITKKYEKTGKRGRPSEKISLSSSVEDTCDHILNIVEDEIFRLKSVSDGLRSFKEKAKK